ncbi:hypothetical protein MYCO108962_19320 [Mycobacterium colombiense]
MKRLALFAIAACTCAACSITVPNGTSPSTKTVTVTPPATSSTRTYAQPSTPTLTGPKTEIDRDGTYVVGVDILPGMYRSPGGTRCYWARLRSLDTSDIIDNNNSTGPQAVDILPTDRAFLTQDCQTWSLASAPSNTTAVQPPANPGTTTTMPGTDAAGFLDGPRCTYRAAFMLRTAQSAVVICDDGSGTYSYKGLRLKDNAKLELPSAFPTATGFTVSNIDGTRYDVSRAGLVISSPGGDVYTEQAIAVAP